MSRPGCTEEGLTLLELILAMAMTSILALSLYTCLQIAFKARDKANASVAPMRAAQVALELISQDLENAMNPTGILAGAFLGTRGGGGNGALSDSLEFYSVGPASSFRTGTAQIFDPTQAGGVRRVELLAGVLEGDTRATLVRRITRNLLSPRAILPEEEILCRNVASFSARYYDGAAWTDVWDSTQLENTMPLLVELSLVLEDGANQATTTYQRFTRICSLACWKEPAATGGGGS